MIKGVIFDMDGVLVDNAKIHIEAFDIFCSKYGTQLDLELLLSMFGMGNDEIMPAILPKHILESHDINSLGNEKEAIYRDIFESKIAPTPGLVDFLNNLRAAGIKTAVGSSGTELNVNFVLEKCNIKDKFDVVINGDMVENRKPKPDIYIRACQELKLDARECLVYEDAHQGIIAARDAGCNVIGLSTTFADNLVRSWKPDNVIKDFTVTSVKDILV
ncbi:MAG: HAD family phosphatase [Rikenellaceae bacterium]